jgi:hypothetical protein
MLTTSRSISLLDDVCIGDYGVSYVIGHHTRQKSLLQKIMQWCTGAPIKNGEGGLLTYQ